MTEKSISFRAHLQSNTVDILQGAGIKCVDTTQLVIGLVSQLAAYTEEGVALAPTVFICNSITGLVRMSGAGEYVPLSAETPTADAAPKILKYAAPLCSDNWRIYVERSKDGASCKFGVFSGSSDPSSLTIDEVTLAELDPGFPIIRVAQNVTNKVEVRTSAGDAIEFRFNDDADVHDLKSSSLIDSLALAACEFVEPPSEPFNGFMKRILAAAIRNSHGTLIAVVKGTATAVPPQLTDAVTLSEPIDLLGRFNLHEEEEKTAVSVGRLQTAAELLEGFVNSDGITVLNGQGKVLAYRAFIKSADPASPAHGGARTRAYMALCELVGKELGAAFFRSQDGRVEIKVATGEAANG